MEKKEIRARIRSILENFDAHSINRRSVLLAHRLFDLDAWAQARCVLAFMSLPTEVETDAIISVARDTGKRVAIPRVTGMDLVFHNYPETGTFIRNRLGIREPEENNPVFLPEHFLEPVLVITPGFAFDKQMHRLGRGGGYYDRFFARYKMRPALEMTAVGVCFSEQLLDSVPVFGLDQSVDLIVTDKDVVV